MRRTRLATLTLTSLALALTASPATADYVTVSDPENPSVTLPDPKGDVEDTSETKKGKTKAKRADVKKFRLDVDDQAETVTATLRFGKKVRTKNIAEAQYISVGFFGEEYGFSIGAEIKGDGTIFTQDRFNLCAEPQEATIKTKKKAATLTVPYACLAELGNDMTVNARSGYRKAGDDQMGSANSIDTTEAMQVSVD